MALVVASIIVLGFIAIGIYSIYLYLSWLRERKGDNSGVFKISSYPSLLALLGMIGASVLIVNLFFSSPHLSAPKAKIHYGKIMDLPHYKRDGYRQLIDEKEYKTAYHFRLIKSHYENPDKIEKKDRQTENWDAFKYEKFYRRRTNKENDSTKDIGNFGLATIHYFDANYDSANHYLKQIKFDWPYVHYLVGNCHLYSDQKEEAKQHYIKEIEINGVVDHSLSKLDQILPPTQFADTLSSILNKHDPSFPPLWQSKYHYLEGNAASYMLSLPKLIIKNINMVGLLAAFLVMCVWLFYVKRIDIFEREKWSYVILTVVLGMLTSFGVYILTDIAELSFGVASFDRSSANLFECIAYIGIPEEFVKILPLFIILLLTNEINEPYDYILYASASALGFAFIENLLYFDWQYVGIIHGRAFTSVVVHMFFSSLVAYGLILSKYKYKRNPFGLFFLFFLIAATLHGLYDFFAFHGFGLLLLLIILIFINYWSRIMNNALNNSKHFDQELQFHTDKLKLYLTISLTAILVFEYIYNGWRLGPVPANKSLLASSVQGSILLLFLTSKLSSFTWYQGHWISLNPWHHYEAPRGIGIFGISGIIAIVKALLASSTPLNYVGYKVFLTLYKYNKRLQGILNDEIRGRIVNKYKLKEWDIGPIRLYDYDWFLVELEQPLALKKGEPHYAFIKFKSGNPEIKDSKNMLAYTRLISDMEIIQQNDVLNLKQFPFYGWVVVNYMGEE